jgi:hypothetical protein
MQALFVTWYNYARTQSFRYMIDYTNAVAVTIKKRTKAELI